MIALMIDVDILMAIGVLVSTGSLLAQIIHLRISKKQNKDEDNH